MSPADAEWAGPADHPRRLQVALGTRFVLPRCHRRAAAIWAGRVPYVVSSTDQNAPTMRNGPNGM